MFQTPTIKIHDTPINDKCLLCGLKYKHNIRYYFDSDRPDLPKTAEIITHCANCRNLLHRIKETKTKLEFLETEVEYLMFIKYK